MERFQFQSGEFKSLIRFSKYVLVNYFNSKVVRLKVCIQTQAATFRIYFNSKVVRLKGDLVETIACIAIFQFQSGAVKRLVGENGFKNFQKFQFQSGAVKSTHSIIVYANCEYISIPKWCG